MPPILQLGGVLCQEQDGIKRVISYAGRSLDKAQIHYGITEKECLALIFSIKHFDCYLRSTKFTAVVDHIALKWLKDIKQPTGRLWRWTILLQAYDFKIEYKPGLLHANADAISRRTYPEPTNEDNNFLYNITLHSDAGHDNVHDNDVSDLESGDNVDDTSGDAIETDIHVDMKNLAALQANDINFRDVITYLQSGDLPANPNCRRDNLNKHTDYFLHDDIQVAIPSSLVPIVLRDTHDSPLTEGHLGFARTIEKTKMRYFWPRMCSDIIKWVETCEICAQKKRPKLSIRAQITPMPSSDPFERISTDILGSLPLCTNSKNQYVLVFVDSFTKYIELISLANIRATTVVRAFLHTIICRHGTLRFLHSDRGTNYLSQIVKETCKLLNIKKTQTTSYHPSCNGQSERMMSFITTFLAKYIDGAQDNWDELIPFVRFAYNTSPCLDSTEYSPYFLVHGLHPVMPSDTSLKPPLNVSKDTASFVGTLLSNLEVARTSAKDILKERKEAMAKRKSKPSSVKVRRRGVPVHSAGYYR